MTPLRGCDISLRATFRTRKWGAIKNVILITLTVDIILPVAVVVISVRLRLSAATHLK